MLSQPDCSIVRVQGCNERGIGFLVDDTHIITCAHVISEGDDEDIFVRPKEAVTITFLFEARYPVYKAHVVKWGAPRKKPCPQTLDIAVLEIEGHKPPNTHPAKLIDEEERGASFRAYGYPQRYEGEDPFWAYGKIHDRLNTGTLQVQHDRNKGIFVQEGFSGGPVWDEIREGVVGMVVAAAPQDGIAFVIPSDQLALAWPLKFEELEEDQDDDSVEDQFSDAFDVGINAFGDAVDFAQEGAEAGMKLFIETPLKILGNLSRSLSESSQTNKSEKRKSKK